MRRREFFGLVGTAATVWSFSANAQQVDRIRKVAVLMNFAAEDVQGKARLQAFSQSLRKAGWIEGTICALRSAGRAITLSVFANMQENW